MLGRWVSPLTAFIIKRGGGKVKSRPRSGLIKEARKMEIDIKVSYRNDNLQRLRQEAGLSQSQLAKAAGINARVLQNYEQGIRDISGAKLATLLKICIALGCELKDIITDSETKELLDKYKSGHNG